MKFTKQTYQFKQPAGTSRGVYTNRKVWHIRIVSPEFPTRVGVGECAPLPGLSCDDVPNYEDVLADICQEVNRLFLTKKEPADSNRIAASVDGIPLPSDGNATSVDSVAASVGEASIFPDGNELCRRISRLRQYPSILFGLETAFRHLTTGSYALWDTPFSRGEAGIPINGLIWMGDYTKMLEQIETKLQSGYRCIKLKIGAIDFEEELALLRHIRAHFPAREVELRVDANGAFSPAEALDRLNRLAELDLHSIEQPIRAGQWEEMARLTAVTPLPIALDEELIGYHTLEEKKQLLDTIRPQYIILKPSLHGGICGGDEWIAEAGKRNIGWWITSALETNIGLNAIAQWCATYDNPLPQGLGTGLLFTNNVEMPLEIRRDCLWWTGQSDKPYI